MKDIELPNKVPVKGVSCQTRINEILVNRLRVRASTFASITCISTGACLGVEQSGLLVCLFDLSSRFFRSKEFDPRIM